MLDLGWQELFVIAAVALVVVGPKDLPRALKAIMAGVRKLRGYASEFQTGINDLVRQADLDDIRRELEQSRAAQEVRAALVDAAPAEVSELEREMRALSEESQRIGAPAASPALTPPAVGAPAPAIAAPSPPAAGETAPKPGAAAGNA